MGQFTEGLEQIRDSISGGMKALPELAANMQPQKSNEPAVLSLNSESLEQLKALAESLQTKMAPVAAAPKPAGDLDIIPDQIKIINTVPDFFSKILNEQLELMRSWMESIFKVGNSNSDHIGGLKALVKDMEMKFDVLLEHVGGDSSEEVEKSRNGKK
ncbi:MAG: hypothetical protein MK132_10910 [Lentisphaerales bacterium]|nr:hypothetical protein [Lentisphaerales bacterium]